MIRRHVIQAIFKRNFLSYFGAPTGYVFIAVFVLLSAGIAFWRDVFFSSNLANLDPLNRYFPFLLLFFVPAVSMAIWAEERKQGTDELLFTLPATDLEILLGKYLSALGIYSVALLFSLTNIIVLAFLGSPDPGVMIGTYIGYWFLGAALLAVAMTASQVTSSQTVAFILGALFCSVPVFLGNAPNLFNGSVGRWLEGAGVDYAFNDLASGVVSLRAVAYFVSLAVVFLYVNLILLARRHTEKGDTWLHFGARALLLVVMAAALGILTVRAGGRIDLTQERLHTLTGPTREVISKIDAGRPVYIQAYLSPEVPENYVETRETLVALLKEFSAMGGDRIQLRIVDTERYSPEARLAEDQFGIKAGGVRQGPATDDDIDAIYMGVAFTCGSQEVVIPFFHRGMPVEYELTRSIGTVSGLSRRRVGIANTDARLFGGLDFQSMQNQSEWQIVAELKKQYDVIQVGLDTPIVEPMDLLLVAQVSSLTQPQMDNVASYLKKGKAGLLFDDPFPYFNAALGPAQPKQNPSRGMFGAMPPPPSDPKGALEPFYQGLGLRFPSDLIVWDTWNPHPDFRQFPKEILFIGRERFSASDVSTSGLQEMAMMWAGQVQPLDATSAAYVPLLTTTKTSGTLSFQQLTQSRFSEPQYRPLDREITLAARIKGAAAPVGAPGATPGATLNLIFVADLDCISDQFFQIRNQAPQDLQLDNVTFVLNCVDVLTGDGVYVDLRKRRPKHRTLEKFEQLTKTHSQKLLDETKDAEEKAKKELEDANARLKAKVAEVEKRTDIDEIRKEKEIANQQQVESKRFEAAKREIEDRKKAAIERSRTTMKQSVSSVKKFIRNLAVFLAPIPALIMGLYMWTRRLAAQGRVS